MSNVREWLRTADPVGSEPPPAHDDMQRVRRAIVTAARESSHLREFRTMPWAVAVIGLVTVVIAGMQTLRLRSTRNDATRGAGDAVWSEPPVTAPRQLQFMTAGGTRVIWQFNDAFELEGSHP